MLTCAYCEQQISPETITCPHCQKPLKAFGHPGIPLHHESKTEYLCGRCLYHQDDTCNFAQRPQAKSCILYQDYSLDLNLNSQTKKQQISFSKLKYWFKRHQGLLLLSILLLFSLILALIAN
jgi:hypothetical protein